MFLVVTMVIIFYNYDVGPPTKNNQLFSCLAHKINRHFTLFISLKSIEFIQLMPLRYNFRHF